MISTAKSLTMHLVFVRIANELTAATEDDLREYTREFMEANWTNPFSTFFHSMSVAVTTRTAHIPDTALELRDPSPSDLSDSEEEDKQEIISEISLLNMVVAILGHGGLADLGLGFMLTAFVLRL